MLTNSIYINNIYFEGLRLLVFLLMYYSSPSFHTLLFCCYLSVEYQLKNIYQPNIIKSDRTVLS